MGKIFEAIKGFFKTKKEQTNLIAKYNARLTAMKKSGNVDMGYLKENLEKANVPLTSSGKISTKGLTAENLRAMEAQIPKPVGRDNYAAYGEEQVQKKKYEAQRQQELQKTVAEQRYKEAMAQRVEEMLAEYYTDEGNSRAGGQFNKKFKSLPVYLQDKIESEMQSLGRMIAKGELDPDTFDSYLEEWASYFE